MRVPIVHDCDPGNDDALGILVAVGHAHLDLKAITTGAGHLAHDRTAQNAAITLAAAAPIRVPVAAGAAGPLVRERLIAQILDQTGGLDPDRPDLEAVPLDGRHAVDLLCAMARACPGLTIAATGPLTNLALALRRDPGFAARVGRIVTLGGAWGLGNKTAAAEWNILCDPEAAAIVYGSGVPITMIPVDASATVPIDAALVETVEAIAGPAAHLAADLLRSLRRTHRSSLFGTADAPLHDPCALLVAAEPGLVRTVPARVDIELAGRFTYGRSVVDFADRSGQGPNAEVVIAFDVARTHRAFLGALTRLSALQGAGRGDGPPPGDGLLETA